MGKKTGEERNRLEKVIDMAGTAIKTGAFAVLAITSGPQLKMMVDCIRDGNIFLDGMGHGSLALVSLVVAYYLAKSLATGKGFVESVFDKSK